MADKKPDLKATHDRLRAEMTYFLEVLARAQAAGATVIQMSSQSCATVCADLTKSVLELEAYLS